MKTVTAKEIQEEVLSAQQALLKEVDEILGSSTHKFNRAQRLQALGFTEAQGTEVIAATRKAAEMRGLFGKYASRYPGLKFIPEEVMSVVCGRYGLGIGPVDRYSGEVPDWAIKVIEDNRHLVSEQTAVRQIGTCAPGNRILMGWPFKKMFTITRNGNNRTFGVGASGEEESCENDRMCDLIVGGYLVIAAPKQQMRMQANEVWNGYNIERAPQRVQDPIVCLKVEHGYIVITAWGEEGQDPRVFNADNN